MYFGSADTKFIADGIHDGENNTVGDCWTGKKTCQNCSQNDYTPISGREISTCNFTDRVGNFGYERCLTKAGTNDKHSDNDDCVGIAEAGKRICGLNAFEQDQKCCCGECGHAHWIFIQCQHNHHENKDCNANTDLQSHDSSLLLFFCVKLILTVCCTIS